MTDFLLQLREEGHSVIVSPHIFGLIEKVCDRVGVIINGKMVVCDTLEAVKAGEELEDRFFQLYQDNMGEV